MIYSSWDIEQNRLKLVFLPFYPLTKNPKNQNFEKMKIIAGDIIILCTKNHNQMYGFWDTEWGRKIFCHFGPFLPFYPLWKNEKCPEIPSFYTYMCTIYEDHMIYSSWNIRCDRQKICHFGHFFALSPLLTTQKIKILKTYKKNTQRYYHFTNVYHKWQSYDVWFLRYGAWRTEFFVILDYFLPFYLNDNPANQNSEKMNKITHTWRRWGTPQNFLLAFIDEVWKTRKIRMLEKMKKNCWRYHHFTCVYQKP